MSKIEAHPFISIGLIDLKIQDVSVIIQKASSTTRPKKQTKPKTATRGKKPSNTTSASTDMSWFDVDAVYGFGTADYD